MYFLNGLLLKCIVNFDFSCRSWVVLNLIDVILMFVYSNFLEKSQMGFWFLMMLMQRIWREMDKLQWGSRKRLRCVKVKECSSSSSVKNGAKSEEETGGNGVIVKKKTTSRVDRRVVATAAAPTTPNHLNDDNNNDTTNTSSRLLQPSCPCPPFQSPNRLSRYICL